VCTSGDRMGLGMKLGVRRAQKRALYQRPRSEPDRVAKAVPIGRGMVGVVGDDVNTRRKRMNI
jgi:hypothetical protein